MFYYNYTVSVCVSGNKLLVIISIMTLEGTEIFSETWNHSREQNTHLREKRFEIKCEKLSILGRN